MHVQPKGERMKPRPSVGLRAEAELLKGLRAERLRFRAEAEDYRRNRPIKYITTDNTTLTKIDVASGK